MTHTLGAPMTRLDDWAIYWGIVLAMLLTAVAGSLL